MKTLITIVGLLLSLGSVAQKGLTIGVQAGVDLTGVRFQDDHSGIPHSSKSAIGYNLNAAIIYSSGGVLGISAEPGLIRKGYIQESVGNDYHFKFNYLALPIMLRFRIVEKLTLGIGAEASYLMSAKVNSYSSKLNYEDIDVSAIAGIDYSLARRLDIALRYSYGLLPLDEITGANEVGLETGKLKTYNTALSLSLRYNFIKPVSN